MVEKFLLFLTDWQRHLSSPLLAKHLKEKKNVKLCYLEVQYVDQACDRAGHIFSDKILGNSSNLGPCKCADLCVLKFVRLVLKPYTD